MWSKELEERIVKHEAYGKEIFKFYNTIIMEYTPIGIPFASVEELSMAIVNVRLFADKQENEEIKKIPFPHIDEMEEMIEKYREEYIEIEKLKIHEDAEKTPLPINPILDKLSHSKDAVITEWKYGKYKCRSLPDFVFEYGTLANNISPDLIRTYLVIESSGKPFAPRTISNAIHRQGPSRKTKSP